MSIVSWNCRGLGSASAVRSVKDVIRSHQPRILGLLETKKSVRSWDNLRTRLGYLNCFAVDRVGLSGGIAVLWKEDIVLTIKHYSRFHVHMEVDLDGIFELTVFYGNPIERKRKESWTLLQQIRDTVQGPWMVMGDFNEVFFGWEVEGQRLRDSANMRRFREAAEYCGLMDLGFNGNSFTFSNKRISPCEYKARLDRVLINSSWKDLFGSVSVLHATAVRSDHCPIVTNLTIPRRRGATKTFMYESMWHRHPDFGEVLDNIWSLARQSSNHLVSSLKICAAKLQNWNSTSFGHVKRSIEGLKQKLEILRMKPRSIALVDEERETVALLDEWLDREEWLWRQRSRVDWLNEGDRNSKFFHAKTSERKKTNWIHSLESRNGLMVTTQPELKVVAYDYFSDLFSSDLATDNINWEEELKYIEPKITDSMNDSLMEPVSNEEIKATLYQMNPSKAPGLDGYPALFFQKNWNLMGDALCDEVKKCLHNGILHEEANITRIALIPKCKNAVRMENYRPISLCPVIMRLISKILANRLKTALPIIISESQSAFIKGRLISDNILIAHELSHYIKTRKGKHNSLASLKLDMSKAFDRIEWTFIEKMLLKLGFRQQWVNQVLLCIRSVSYKVQVNNELSDLIFPSRGIRQGDPISPYLFIICSEWLSSTLNAEVNGIRFNSEAPSISHLFFADDSLIFSKASPANFRQIKYILQRYQRISAQKVNFQKSEIVFSPNVEAPIKQEISELLNIKEALKHSRYLGLPLIVGQNKQDVFRFIEEKCHKKMTDWKTKLLSSAGKETLIKAVIQAIPQYTMACYKLPPSTCERLVKMILHFWWSHNASPKPIPWLKRKILYEDKDLGGLGLRCPIVMNSALLLKQTWRIQSDPNLLISKVFKSKYFKTTSLLLAGLGSSPSHAWRSLFRIKHHLMDGIVFPEADARPIWKLSSCGEYTAKSGYYLLKEAGITRLVPVGRPSDLERYQTFWKRFWKIQLPGKIKIFGWRCFHNGLPDALNLRKRCLQICSNCVYCGFELEDLRHLLRDCWVAKAVGMNLQLPDRIFEVCEGTPGDWFWWCSTELSENQFRSLLCAAWCIWSSRNAIRNDKKGWSVMEIVAKVQSLIGRWDRYASSKFAGMHLSGEARHHTIYCDGSWINSHSPTGIAAVYIIDGDIRVISAKYLSNVRSSREAEGEALCLGLKLAESMKLSSVTLFSDSVEVAGAFFNPMISGSFQPEWLTSGIKILANCRNWRVEHCVRDQNSFADSVAKYARAFSWSWNNLEDLPSIDFNDC